MHVHDHQQAVAGRNGAEFMANELATLTTKDLRDIHLVMSCLTLPAHIELFKKGLIRQVDFPRGSELRWASDITPNDMISRIRIFACLRSGPGRISGPPDIRAENFPCIALPIKT